MNPAAAIVGDIIGLEFDRWAKVLRASSFELPTPSPRKAAKKSVERTASGARKLPMVDPHCFLAGTKVLTKSGRKSIEDIKVGDEVLSRNDKTGEQGYKKVARLFRGSTRKVVHLKVRKRLKKARTERHSVGQRVKGKSSEGGEDGDGDADDSAGDPDSEQYLRCTEEHPFWVDGKDWVNAKDLKLGDKLRGSNGEELEVSGHEIKDEEADHYNFEVQDFHTYFVADGKYDSYPGIWVHNDCLPRSPYLGPGQTAPKQHPNSRSLGPDLEDGDYAYVRDTNGVLQVLPDGPALHSKVLGDGRKATGAGGLTIKDGAVVSIDNGSGHFQFPMSTMGSVLDSVKKQGLKLDFQYRGVKLDLNDPSDLAFIKKDLWFEGTPDANWPPP